MTRTKSLYKSFSFTILLLLSLLQLLLSHPLKVHLIVHSHLDLGWRHTINEYFTGSNTLYSENVQRMLSEVFDQLSSINKKDQYNNKRTYTIAELGYLDLWWRSKNKKEREKVIKLVQDGRLELVNGGWASNDEACTTYDDIMQNFIIGQRWTNQNLNYNNAEKNVGWQMDSFGTSVTQAYLMKEAGYEGLFFSRIDNAERQKRKDGQTMEFEWQFPNSEEDSIFTHVMSRLYSEPPLPRAPYINEVFINGYLNQKDLDALNETIWNDRAYYKTDHVLLFFGGDFFMSSWANGVYQALDAVINYFKWHPEYGVDMFYSTPKRFIKEVKAELAAKAVTLSTKQGDFFPLNEQSGTVWTGFYTSKSNFKGLVRWHSRYLTAVKLLVSQRAMQRFNVSDTAEDAAIYQAITDMEKALATMQHHDAITGTMRERVRYDYEDILAKARRNLADRISGLLLSGIQSNQNNGVIVESMNITYDSLLGGLTSPEVSGTTLPAGSELILAVMNPGNTRLFLLTTNISSTSISDKCIVIESSDGRIISPDIICRGDPVECSVYFTDNIEAYSWIYYQVKELNSSEENKSCGSLLTSEEATSGTKIISPNWTLQLDDGNLFTFIQNQDGETVEKQFRFSYSYYESSLREEGKHHASGAYLFRPRSVEKKSLSVENQTIYWAGNHVAIIQIQSANFTTTIQLLMEQDELGFSVITQLNPISGAKNGCEIIMEINVPELQTDGKFFTDSNGYFMLERPYTPASPQETPEDEIAKNYYPMTTRCSLEGNNGTEAFSIFTDRAQGVSIQQDNQINIMIHRVTVKDDEEGVSETLNEKYHHNRQPVAVTTWHYFLWSNLSNPEEKYQPVREQAQYDFERPLFTWLFSANPAFSLTQMNQNNKASTLSFSLPKSLKLSTRTYTQNEHSIRLQNLDPNNNLSIVLLSTNDSSSLLSFLSQNPLARPISISETSWTTTNTISNSSNFDVNGDITLDFAPLQMRTFRVSFMDAPESSEMNTGPGPGDLDPILPWYGYYLCLHGCVAVIYLLLCLYRAKEKRVSITSFKREICIVVCLGPFGIGVLLWMRKNSNLVSDKQALIDASMRAQDGYMKIELPSNQEKVAL